MTYFLVSPHYVAARWLKKTSISTREHIAWVHIIQQNKCTYHDLRGTTFALLNILPFLWRATSLRLWYFISSVHRLRIQTCFHSPPPPQSGSQFVPCGWAGLFPPPLSVGCGQRHHPPIHFFPDWISSPPPQPAFFWSVCLRRRKCQESMYEGARTKFLFHPSSDSLRGAKSPFCSRELFKKGKCGSLQRREIYLHSSFPLLKKVYKCH